MRTITDHKLNGLNEAIEIIAEDNPGAGGANHHYTLNYATSVGLATRLQQLAIHFQNGPINEAGVNGISNEALLAVLIDRMRGFQFGRIVIPAEPGEIGVVTGDFDFNKRGQYACRENACALTHLEEALMWLQKRTRDRTARGVEGTSAK